MHHYACPGRVWRGWSLAPDDKLRLHALVDHSVVEVSANNRAADPCAQIAHYLAVHRAKSQAVFRTLSYFEANPTFLHFDAM